MPHKSTDGFIQISVTVDEVLVIASAPAHIEQLYNRLAAKSIWKRGTMLLFLILLK